MDATGWIDEYVGISFSPAFWGFSAAISECVGGLLIMAGFVFRPACVSLLLTMTVAATIHIGNGDPFVKYSHALESAILFAY